MVEGEKKDVAGGGDTVVLKMDEGQLQPARQSLGEANGRACEAPRVLRLS